MNTDLRLQLLANAMGLSSGRPVASKTSKVENQVKAENTVPLDIGASAFAFRNRGLAEMFRGSGQSPWVR